MKKVIVSIMALVFAGQMSFAQPVSDHAVIPVGITLNQIMRLQVLYGGNIEFVVNTLEQMGTGIANTSGTDTRFTCAASVDFNVRLFAEDASFLGTDNYSTDGSSTNSMVLENVAYRVEATGIAGATTRWSLGTGAGATLTSPTVVIPLNNTSTTTVIQSVDGSGAGDKAQNDFIINWELCTSSTRNVASGDGKTTLLDQDLAADRYVTNVFLILEAQ